MWLSLGKHWHQSYQFWQVIGDGTLNGDSTIHPNLLLVKFCSGITTVKFPSKFSANFSWISRKSAKDNMNIRGWTHRNKLVVALMIQSGAIKPLKKKREQQDDIIKSAYQTTNEQKGIGKHNGNMIFLFFCANRKCA